ncbi:phosphatidylserine decarboxylase [Auriscalpium vulgare]|uniref:Phosphatidylserine decarboxylase n=1 Tax=Auriscalpium vulgare TaxID=40419 RepID=A0ACB8RPT5_9AGAM|nr:phosphatidylserine decarboxylase [Auriscalpium vulgare]
MVYTTERSKYSGWLPSPIIRESYLAKHVKHAKRAVFDPAVVHVPAVQAFKDAIEGDSVMKTLFDQIFLQVAEENQVPDFETLLYILDTILPSAPPYFVAKDGWGNPIGEPVGVPIYLIFDLLSNTGAAYDLFRLPSFNHALKNLLNAWGSYLSDPKQDSNAVLNTGKEGWFSQAAIKLLETHLGQLTFNQTYHTPNPNADNRGYETWDDFFVRKFNPGVRPVDAAADPSLIHSACESTVYRIARKVRPHDQFWLKSQKYSLYDILDRDQEMAEQFIGGTVYQAFLSPLDSHRWRAPVNGTIEKVVSLDGTYYAVLPDEGEPVGDDVLPKGSPYGALIRSQGFLTISSARVLIYIRADNPVIGLMCFVGIGMAEVSTCEVTVKEKQRVSTGDEIGMFHFGGSSHTLIFGPQCNVTFADNIKENEHIWVNSIIAQVSAAETK